MKIDAAVCLNALDIRTAAARKVLNDIYGKTCAGQFEVPPELAMEALNFLEEICTLYTAMREHGNK